MGTRNDFEEMNLHIEEKNIQFGPLLAGKSFAFADAKDAFELLGSGKFQGKIVIKVE